MKMLKVKTGIKHGRKIMKHLLKISITLGLVLFIAATGFAFVNPTTKFKPVVAAQKQTNVRKLVKSRRHSSKKTAVKKRTSVRRVRRLTERQRRYFNQRLLNIFIN